MMIVANRSYGKVNGARLFGSSCAAALVVLLAGIGTAGEPSGAPSPAVQAATPPKKAAEHTAVFTEKISKDVDYLLALYKHFHTHPELSLMEVKTAARLAEELKAAGCEVTTGVGGTGVVGLLRNGPGPTVLIRADMDALPVVERTDLSYASTVRGRDREGKEVGVMHACGHDMHMACLVGTARLLAGLKDRWQGTLVCIGQPAEEMGDGARRMLNDGLFKRFPKPDYALALHCDYRTAHGQVSFTEGMALANVDSVDIIVRGKGGHGAAPHATVDPIVLAARIILDLQTLVSREIDPTDPAVVTVGSIHGGTKHNIIPNDVKLQLTVRSLKDSVRKHLLEGIARIAKAAAVAARAPEPTVTVDPVEFTPAMINDVPLTRKTVALFREVLGEQNVHERPAVMGGEDFARYGRAGVPIFMFFLGTQPPERIAEAKREGGRPLISVHADQFFPIPEPSLRTGVLTLSLSVLNLVGK